MNCIGKCGKECGKCPIKWLLLILAVVVLFFYFTGAYAQYSYGGGGGGTGASGGGNSSSLQRDYCPDGDMTFSYYDGMCDEGVVAETNETEASETYSTVTTIVGTTNTVITTEEEEMMEELLTIVTVESDPIRETIVLPDFLPETGAHE